jgi:hypothetical protein
MWRVVCALLLGAALFFVTNCAFAAQASSRDSAAAGNQANAHATISASGSVKSSSVTTRAAIAEQNDADDSADDSDEPVAKIVLPPGRQSMLDANNALRAELGLAPFAWSRHLAHTARLWAKHLAVEAHSLVHSHTEGMGENLSFWSSGYKTPAGLVGLWADEKPNFVHALFPNVAKAGDWHTVGHYSQIVWRSTTKVGCGIATDDKNDYLVCEYWPQGNIMGEPVY